MKLLSIAKILLLAGGVLAASGCSSDDGKCSAPQVTGSPIISSGTGSVHGSGTLPAGIPDGQQLELLVQTSNMSAGVFPDNLFDVPHTCGAGFTFNISHLDAGTYNLGYEIYNPSSQSSDPTFSGTSTNAFVVAEGQSVEFKPTF